mgnify:CR=1 FL=1|tara:strand:- start:936 stop:1208 length:273 start_codon:yes stop_codon:yes gene_type:complete
MIKRIKNFFFIAFCLCSFFLIVKYYFSEKNVILINKLRSSYDVSQKNEQNNLPLLKNDTSNVIVYIDGLETFKKKRKKRFWEKLISNDGE